MRALYTKRSALPSPRRACGALAAILLAGCGEEPPPPPAPPEEPWPHEAEALFQRAEALRFELERLRLERARLEALERSADEAAPAER